MKPTNGMEWTLDIEHQSMRKSCECHRKSDRVLGSVRSIEIQIEELARSEVSCGAAIGNGHESGEDNRRDNGIGREMLMNGWVIDRT